MNKTESNKLASKIALLARSLQAYSPTRASKKVITVVRGDLDVGLEIGDPSETLLNAISKFDDRCVAYDLSNVFVVRSGATNIELVDVSTSPSFLLSIGDLVVLHPRAEQGADDQAPAAVE